MTDGNIVDLHELIRRYIIDSIAAQSESEPLDGLTLAEAKEMAAHALRQHFQPYEVKIQSIDFEKREVTFTVELPPQIERA